MDKRINIDANTDPVTLKLNLDVVSDFERKEDEYEAEHAEEYVPNDESKNCSLCGRVLVIKDNDYDVSKSNGGRSGVMHIICKVCSDKIKKKYPGE